MRILARLCLAAPTWWERPKAPERLVRLARDHGGAEHETLVQLCEGARIAGQSFGLCDGSWFLEVPKIPKPVGGSSLRFQQHKCSKGFKCQNDLLRHQCRRTFAVIPKKAPELANLLLLLGSFWLCVESKCAIRTRICILSGGSFYMRKHKLCPSKSEMVVQAGAHQERGVFLDERGCDEGTGPQR